MRVLGRWRVQAFGKTKRILERGVCFEWVKEGKGADEGGAERGGRADRSRERHQGLKKQKWAGLRGEVYPVWRVAHRFRGSGGESLEVVEGMGKRKWSRLSPTPVAMYGVDEELIEWCP